MYCDFEFWPKNLVKQEFGPFPNIYHVNGELHKLKPRKPRTKCSQIVRHHDGWQKMALCVVSSTPVIISNKPAPSIVSSPTPSLHLFHLLYYVPPEKTIWRKYSADFMHCPILCATALVCLTASGYSLEKWQQGSIMNWVKEQL